MCACMHQCMLECSGTYRPWFLTVRRPELFINSLRMVTVANLLAHLFLVLGVFQNMLCPVSVARCLYYHFSVTLRIYTSYILHTLPMSL